MREMKDSGIEWIGELPIGWETRKIKYVATLNGRIGWQGLTSSEYCDDGAYLITGINFDNGQIDWSTCVHVPMERWAEAPQIQIQNGDLLITKDGTVGKVAIVSNMPSETSLNSGVLLIRTVDSCYKKYLFWILQSEIFWKWFNTINAGNSTIIHLYQYDFCNFSFPFPKYSLQCNIANYLDRKCSQIDAIIARQQEVIEKLKAYKLSVITEAVTKGLNPDTPMKDSGVEWIGEIPEYWQLSHIGNLVEMGSGGTPDRKKPEYWENGNIPWMSSGEINDEYIYSTTEHITELGLQNSNAKILPVNTVMLGLIGQGKTKGLTAILKTEVCCNQNLAYLIADEKYLHYRYLFYCFKAMYFYIRGLVGESQAGIYSYFLKKLHIPLPDIEQQIRISDYLDTKCEAIKNSINKRERIIEKFTSYKRSLIYEVVTGKKEVQR